MIEAGGSVAGWARLDVFVQDDEVLVAIAEGGDRVAVAVDVKAQRVVVPGDGAVQVRNRQLDGAEPEPGRK